MNTLAAFAVLLLASFASSAPLSDDLLTITSEFFPEAFSVYKSDHDIVNLFCPLNSINFDEDADLETFNGASIYVFFVEADVNGDEIDYKGLYVLKNKQATKLLDNGRDFAATTDDSKKVYLAATDGLYVFNAAENKAEIYGSVTDSLIGVAVINGTDQIYVLTEDRVLYKVTEEGTKKEEVTDVKDAVQIVLDFEENLFFVDSKKHVYMKPVDGGAIKKIKGLSSSPTFAKLLRPPFILDEGLPFVAGKKIFAVYPNGTSEYENIILKDKPTAYSIEATLLQYYAYNKQIYEYNILAILLGSSEMEELQNYFSDKTDEIKTMGNKSRKSFRA